jgi:hypothetical protein
MEKYAKGRTDGETGGWVYVNKKEFLYLVSLSYKNNRRKRNIQERKVEKIISRHRRKSHSEI